MNSSQAAQPVADHRAPRRGRLHSPAMKEPPIPPDEAKRLELLRACHIMYTEAEQAFDEVAQLAADLCGTEIALITLVDSDYQWFKARVGIEQTGTARDLSFCGHCIVGSRALIVEDTLTDPRFADNPLVTGDPHLRFYAGVPLEVAPGSAIGALSVAARAPRTLSDKQLDALRRLARQISRELGLRRDMSRSAPPPMSEEDLPIGPGAVVAGRWKLLREVGRGGVGAVFEALDPGGARAAIKLLLPKWRKHEQLLERFAREARVLMRLTTPHVGKLFDVGNLDKDQGDLPFLVLEYLEGTDLERVVAERGRVPFGEAFAWAADACDGLLEAHHLGVYHRDLKPSNVFLADQGPRTKAVVKVVDFGIAAGDPGRARATSKLTSGEAPIGSPPYMSPEQMLGGEIDARTDIWSMGALLYETITGHLPFPGDTELQTFAAVLTRPPLPLRAHLKEPFPAGIEPIVLKCLSKDRGARYESMAALASALRSTG
jgi:tRNA A-37 threonylcarbamoyl transferase component Bud32